MLYFAYGSNLNYTRMFDRCNSAMVLGVAQLSGYKLVFMENNSKRIVANLIKNSKSDLEGVVYEVSKADLDRMDKFEGHPFVYKRTEVEVELRGTKVKCITYIMPKRCNVCTGDYVCSFNRGYGVPKKDYFQHLERGYNMFNLNNRVLMEAYQYSYIKKRNKGGK